MQQKNYTRGAVEEHREARREEKRVHKKKNKRDYDKQELIELESLRSSNAIRAYYQKLNGNRKDFQPRTTLCRDNEVMILGSDEAILGRWAQPFEELLNGNAPERIEDMTTIQKQGNFETERNLQAQNISSTYIN
jgi:hypothetical protein